MTCAYAHHAGAYVLGALSPQERLEFEHHCAECAMCSAAVRDLAGLPGLLARADPSVLDAGLPEEPLPDSVLPRLMAEIRRGRRNRNWLLAGAAAAVMLGIGGGGVAVGVAVAHNDGAVTAAPANTRGRMVTMQPVRAAPASATVHLAARPWGTELHLTCAYAQGRDRYQMPPEVTYLLIVRGRDGAVQNVGTWNALRDRTMQLTAATALPVDEISAVEVRTVQGRAVLRTPAL